MRIDNNVLSLLPELGFSESESKIVLTLLSGNALSAARIARGSGVKRPTAYAILNSLIDRGLVVRAQSGTTTTFALVPVEMLTELISNREEQRLVKVQNAAESLKRAIASRRDSERLTVSDFQIEVLESYDAVYHQLLEVLTSGDFDAVFDPQIVLPGDGKKVVGDFLRRTSGDGPRIREVVVTGKDTDWYRSHVKNKNHSIKEIDRSHVILSDIIIASGSVIISHYNPPEELAIKITHEAYCKSMRTMFELIWQSLE
ncbi:MAG: helix-turn-helix domain-containing protein [Bdellovibrionales bacterium]|nr:helix-turn-helix domain-containing protein [Bdellovibrionales bacterium]